MDIIVFNDLVNLTYIRYGKIVNDLTSKMWIERFDKASEFTFTASAAGNIQKVLPIGALVSHVNTSQLMIVENHEIVDNADKDPIIKITGRGYETFFDNRSVGTDRTAFPRWANDQYPIAGTEVGNQIKLLWDHHNYGYNPGDSVPNVYAVWNGVSISPPVARTIERGPLYTRMEELAKIDKLGITALRPFGPNSNNTSATQVIILIHSGVDRSQEVMLSYAAGDIVGADYLWSNKFDKNAALVTGKWLEVIINPSETGARRRTMYIEAKDIDNAWNDPPSTNEDIWAISAALDQRGREILKSQNQIILTKAETSKEGLSSFYRKNYNVGDLISVYGQYNDITKMRVTEYVEFEDENGENGYPTLNLE
jgi:hypothetical protein